MVAVCDCRLLDAGVWVCLRVQACSYMMRANEHYDSTMINMEFGISHHLSNDFPFDTLTVNIDLQRLKHCTLPSGLRVISETFKHKRSTLICNATGVSYYENHDNKSINASALVTTTGNTG